MIRHKRILRHFRYASFVVSVSLFMVFSSILAGYVYFLNQEVTTHFEGNRWSVPSRVYARPLELFEGKNIHLQQVTRELAMLRYKQVSHVSQPGQYRVHDGVLEIFSRGFEFWDGEESARRVVVQFGVDRLKRIEDLTTGKPVTLFRLDPMFIGGIYPNKKQDRILVRLDEVPELLVQTLLATEDRLFYEHEGISPRSILRAIYVNVSSGARVQGGSTLTQQLVKNFFLNNEKSYLRKINEAIMSLLLEWHYSKSDILEAYLNEVYLGQDGSRAIHGYGLASWFFFEKSLGELQPDEIAFLVGLVKGPSYYDPRRYASRAVERRNVVLKVMLDQGLMKPEDYTDLVSRDLGVLKDKPPGNTPYPAFIDLVKRQLAADFPEAVLKKAGLRLYTTLDPIIQSELEAATSSTINELEKQGGRTQGHLQAAALFSDRISGEVLAITGGRDADFNGFNRALDARRPVGSLIKPAVYLTALAEPSQYNLASRLRDEALTTGDDWQPRNYDGLFHGEVPLFEALAQSYNLATVNLGLEIGLEKVVATLKQLGIDQDVPLYPSVLLGALELSPYQVLRMYQTLAGGGFQVPVRSLRAVSTGDGQPLNRYSLQLERVATPESIYLINVALQNVVRSGTGQRVYQYLPADVTVAGKTGTTDDYRDSWFAGYSDNIVGVVWMGQDDNQSANLTGSSGALKLWARTMSQLNIQPLNLVPPASIEFVYMDVETGARTDSSCKGAIELPVQAGYAPAEWKKCSTSSKNLLEKTMYWFKDMF